MFKNLKTCDKDRQIIEDQVLSEFTEYVDVQLGGIEWSKSACKYLDVQLGGMEIV
jgi:hypothetical protein